MHGAAVETLAAWSAPDERQDDLRRAYLEHLAAHADAVWRDGPPQHLTASCLVVDEAGERALLSLHRKGRFWVQFGGHAEPADVSLREVARREAREESGIVELEPGLEPFDLDRHVLPAGFGRCREHLDVVYLAVVRGSEVPVVSTESDDVAWWPIDRLPASVVPDLPPRLARAAERVRGA